MKGIFLDSEANGLNIKKHVIIEIAFQIRDLITGVEKDSYNSLISPPYETWKHSNKESLKLTGLTWDEVQKGKKEEEVSEEIKNIFKRNAIKRGEAVFICQNPSFDRAFFSKLIDADVQERLNWPYHWLDLASMHFAMNLTKASKGEGPYPWEIGLSKDKIAEYYKLGKEEKPHRAMNGVKHLIQCYEAVVGFPSSSEKLK